VQTVFGKDHGVVDSFLQGEESAGGMEGREAFYLLVPLEF